MVNVKSKKYVDSEEDTYKERYLTFQPENEAYITRTQNISEIIGIKQVTISGHSEYIMGIIILKDKTVSVTSPPVFQ